MLLYETSVTASKFHLFALEWLHLMEFRSCFPYEWIQFLKIVLKLNSGRVQNRPYEHPVYIYTCLGWKQEASMTLDFASLSLLLELCVIYFVSFRIVIAVTRPILFVRLLFFDTFTFKIIFIFLFNPHDTSFLTNTLNTLIVFILSSHDVIMFSILIHL